MAGTAVFITLALTAHIFAAVVFSRRHVFRPSGVAARRRGAGPGAAPDVVVARARPLFAWVFAAIVMLLISGYVLVFVLYRGFRGVALYVQLMMGLGILMMVLLLDLYFAPWRRFRLAVARQDWVEGGRQLGQIRAIVTVNLVLGLVVAIGGNGRYW